MKETAYLLQAALICAWWMGLASSNRIFAAFQFDGIPPTAFWAFFAPDIIFIALLSAVRAYWKQSSLEYMILGAFGYASFYCCNATLLTFSGYLPTGLMALGLFYNVFLCFHAHLFRTASTGGKWNTTKTVVQIVCIWFLTLVIIPYMILDAFHTAPIQYDEWRMIVGAVLFLSFSFLGLLSAYFMVREGDGTPLPLDQTNRLVTAGPYGYVRNPMAIAGIGQGLSVALVFDSVPILIYSLLGAVIWQLVVRPFEERDLSARFGEPYLQYRQRVSCWIPTLQNRVSK